MLCKRSGKMQRTSVADQKTVRTQDGSKLCPQATRVQELIGQFQRWSWVLLLPADQPTSMMAWTQHRQCGPHRCCKSRQQWSLSQHSPHPQSSLDPGPPPSRRPSCDHRKVATQLASTPLRTRQCAEGYLLHLCCQWRQWPGPEKEHWQGLLKSNTHKIQEFRIGLSGFNNAQWCCFCSACQDESDQIWKLHACGRCARKKTPKQKAVGPDTKNKSASQVKKTRRVNSDNVIVKVMTRKRKMTEVLMFFCAHMEYNPTSLFIMLTYTAQRMERQQRRIRRLEQGQIASMSRHQHVISTEVLKNL